MKKNQWHKPYRVKKKKPAYFFLKNRIFWLILLAAAAVFVVFYYLFLSSFFQIKNTAISGNQNILTENIQETLEPFLDGWRGNFFTFSSTKAENAILANFPEIEQIEVKKKLKNSLVINVREREARAVLVFNNQEFLMDKNGIIFKVNVQSDKKYTKIKNLLFREDFAIKLGETRFDEIFLKNIIGIDAKLKNIGVESKEFSLVNLERLDVKTAQGWEIYLSLEEDLDWQIEKLSQVLEIEIPLRKRGMLEYVDLRFSKVYYKYR